MNKRQKLKVVAYLKFVVLSFMNKELTLFAASLSFYTIFAFIPLLLIMMTFLTSLEIFEPFYLKVQALIFDNLLPVNSKIIMNYIDNFLQNSVGISIFSTILLFLSSIFFYQNYEYIVNKVFHAPQRKLLYSLGVYFLLLIITPLGLAVAFFLSGGFVNLVSYTTLNLSFLVPYFIIWVVFFMLYKLSVNVSVDYRAALISSFFISLVFSVAKNIFIYYVFINQSYTTIYGSFSVLIFFFLWIYLSWIIFIYGLRICYLINRVYTYKQTKKK